MTNPENSHAKVARDIEDCRQLSSLIFDDTAVGIQTDITYTPLQFGIEALPKHFLKFIGGYDRDIGSGSIELVQTHDDGSEAQIMGYFVNEIGGLERNLDDEPALVIPIVWPEIFKASQISRCLDNFRNPEEEKEIDPSILLDELVITHHAKQATPHIRLKKVEGIDIEGFTVDFFHEVHAMPVELASRIKMSLSIGELLKMDVGRDGKNSFSSIMVFDGRGNLVGIKSDKIREVEEHVGKVASFKRLVFDY